ncbi:hypothetical protein ACP275_13G098300 [Erythranthe tilingii]
MKEKKKKKKKKKKMATCLSHFRPKANFLSKSKSRSKTNYKRRRIIAAAQNKSAYYWASIEADIDTYLKKVIPVNSPESVVGPMHHLIFAAPRTGAAALCVAACELVGGDRRQAMAAAAAVHLMHAAAYTHEHLSLMTTGRPGPEPEIEHKYSPNIELLIGDGLIPFGLELLAGSFLDRTRNDPDRVVRVMIEITIAVGSQGTVDGLYRKLGAIDGNYYDYEVIMEYVCRKRDGELHGCGAACGAVLGGGAEEEVEKLRKFGVYAGVVRGLTAAAEKNHGVDLEGKIEEMKELAMMELKGLRGREIELISSHVFLAEPSLAS